MAQQKKPADIRELAFDIFLEIMEEDAFCDRALHDAFENHTLDKRSRSFLMCLVCGAVERCIEIDYVIGRFSKVRVEKMRPAIRGILRLGVYQILYMDSVPDAAVCNEAVKLAAKRGFYRLKGFVNGVLRAVARGKGAISYPEKENDLLDYLRVRYSMPEWIVNDFLEQYGEEQTEEILKAFFEKPKEVSVRCMKSKCQPEELRRALEKEGVSVTSGRLFDFALHISGYDSIEKLSAFRQGMFQIQDESSMLVGAVAGVRPGDTVLDICSAPGGKALHAADILAGSGRVVAADISESRARRIRENVRRSGVSGVDVIVHDALVHRREWEESADVLIADLPCSGLGVIGNKCDIKYKTAKEDVAALAELQRKILTVAAAYVKPGGRLVYSTCTVHREENEKNAEWLKKALGFTPVSIEKDLPPALRGRTGERGWIQLLPGMAGTDGFFVACFEK